MRRPSTTPMIVAFMMLSLSTNSAWAGHKTSEDPPGSSENSQETALVRKGLGLRQKGQDEAALQEFRSAYQLAHSGHALAQIALAEQALGRWVEAEGHLSEALTRTLEGWIVSNKKYLTQALGDIQGHLGSLELTGEAKPATVLVNGVQVGTLPLTAPLRVPAGSVAFEVQAAGYMPFLRTIVVPARGLAREPIVFVAVVSPPGKAPSPVVQPPQLVESAVQPNPESSSPKPSTWRPRQTVGAIIALAAVGALATGVSFQLIHESNAKLFNRNQCSTTDSAACRIVFDRLKPEQSISIAGYAGAVVLGGVATYLFLSGAEADSKKVAAVETGVRLQCGPTASLGMLCAGRF